MKIFFTSIIVLLITSALPAQGLTGIWRGYFVQKDFDIYKGKPTEDRYKYEVQLNNLKNNAIEGVTYSYKTTVFYGKADMQGIYTKSTKNLLIRETKMLELKTSGNTLPCLMTCYLDYTKSNGKEMLTGTYTSISEKNNDCGSGTVYLEKVTTTEFEKEPFLLKKKEVPVLKKTLLKSTEQKKLEPQTITKPKFKPGAEGYIIDKNTATILTQKTQPIDTVKAKTIQPIVIVPKKQEPVKLIPKVLLERENNLQKTVIVDQQDVRIDYYDNGQVDNDTITVYHNNEILINRGRLDIKPLTLTIHLDAQNPTYELITVAENLGDTPPNTALMVITSGRKRYEVNITSDERKNAKVILEYKPTEKNK